MKSECWWILNTLQCWCFPCSGKIGAQSCSDPRSALTPCPEKFHFDYELQWTIMMHQLSNHYPKSCPWSFIWSRLWLLMMGWEKKYWWPMIMTIETIMHCIAMVNFWFQHMAGVSSSQSSQEHHRRRHLPCLSPWWQPWQGAPVKARVSAFWTSTWWEGYSQPLRKDYN